MVSGGPSQLLAQRGASLLRSQQYYAMPAKAGDGCRNLLSALSQRKHCFGVAVADLLHVLLGQIERLHHCDRGADVAPAFFLVERTIGRKQHVIRSEERQSANRRRARAGERGVAVELLEIIKRSLL